MFKTCDACHKDLAEHEGEGFILKAEIEDRIFAVKISPQFTIETGYQPTLCNKCLKRITRSSQVNCQFATEMSGCLDGMCMTHSDSRCCAMCSEENCDLRCDESLQLKEEN